MTDDPVRRYGWRPSLPDFRDFQLSALLPRAAVSLPDRVDLRTTVPPIRDQGPLGSCTGFGSTNAYHSASVKAGRRPPPLSALFAYYNARALEGTTRVDAGATCRDVVKGLARFGAAPETHWPYVVSNFDDRPPPAAYNAGLVHQAINYYAVPQSLGSLRQALAAGYVVIVGFSVYESFESSAVARSGRVPLPGPGEQLLGGHCVVLCGYDMNRPMSQRWDLVNQWGVGWGNRGYFTMPESYLTNPGLSGDFWVIRATEG